MGKDLLRLIVIFCAIVCWVNSNPLPCTITFVPSTNSFDFTDSAGNLLTPIDITHPLPRKCGGNPYTLGVFCNGLSAEGFFTVTLSDTIGTIGNFPCAGGAGCCPFITIPPNRYAASPLPDLPATTTLTVSVGGVSKSFITGDPHFLGLNGQHFDMQGTKNKIYNIFSDPHISINGLFTEWSKQKRANVISAMSIMFESHSIILIANQITGNSTATNLLVDNEVITLPVSQVVNVTPCVNLEWKNFGIHFLTPGHMFSVYAECKIFHDGVGGLNRTQCYLNFKFAVDFGEYRSVGGILGETAKEDFSPSNIIETDFIEETMTSNSSPKKIHSNTVIFVL